MELTIEQLLQQGFDAHKEGRLQDAERLYRAILQSQPAHPDANHNLGVLAVSVNKSDVALPLFKTALEANPKVEQFWLSYINALIKEHLAGLEPAVKRGERLSKAMQPDIFSPMAIQMVLAGEESGRLDTMLIELAQVYEAEVESDVKRALTLLEPALILGMGGVIAVIIMGILMGILSVNTMAF